MSNAIAENVTDFGSMSARKVGINQYSVLNYGGEKPTAYAVNIREMTCGCGDSTYNGEDHKVCKHLAKAIHQAPADVEIDEAFLQLARDTFDQLNQAADRLSSQATQPPQQAATSLDSSGDANSSADASDGAGTGSTDESDDEDTDELNEDITPNEAQQALLDKISGWIIDAQQFNDDIDPTIVDLEWAELNGTEGVHVDLNPFDSPNGYWDGEDNEWADKDAYDTARSAMADMLSNIDAVEYTGPPEYINFVAEDDVGKVIG